MWLLALLLKPLFLLLVFGGICLPIRWAAHKWLPEGPLKQSLLKHRGGTKDALCR
jgi:hypothetical protein